MAAVKRTASWSAVVTARIGLKSETGAAALIIAHPGHELRVYGWLAKARPATFVLTDGSGHSGRSRLESTTRVLAGLGAKPADVYGRLTDKELYTAMLEGRVELFSKIVAEIARSLVESKADIVAGDAIEGFNPGHDLCRVIIDAAVRLARKMSDREIRNYDFPLTGRPDSYDGRARSDAVMLELDQQTFDRKIAAARHYGELSQDVEEAFSDVGIEAFRFECLRPAGDSAADSLGSIPPLYERYGEQRVASGYYKQVLRYREHFLPLAEALSRRASEEL